MALALPGQPDSAASRRFSRNSSATSAGHGAAGGDGGHDLALTAVSVSPLALKSRCSASRRKSTLTAWKPARPAAAAVLNRERHPFAARNAKALAKSDRYSRP